MAAMGIYYILYRQEHQTINFILRAGCICSHVYVMYMNVRMHINAMKET